MARRGICVQCEDANNPVTSENGGSLSKTVGGQRMWVADIHRNCKEVWLTANGAADFAALEASDRNLLLNGLPHEGGPANFNVSPGSLRIGNLELIFDKDESLKRLRIHGARGWSRQFLVREPQENLSI
jgi:hypothetical protein